MDWLTARTLYNLVDARWPEWSGTDAVFAIERAVQQAGPGAARRLRLSCRILDWQPVVLGPVRRRFWRLPISDRAAAVRRWERSRLSLRRVSFELVASALDDQSWPGA